MYECQYIFSQAGYYRQFSRSRRRREEIQFRDHPERSIPRITTVSHLKQERNGAPGLWGGCGGDPAEAERRRRAGYPGPGKLP